MTFRMPSDELRSRHREAARAERQLQEVQAAVGTLACEGVGVSDEATPGPDTAQPAASIDGELDFEWVGNFPDKSVGYIDPHQHTSIYRDRLQ